MQFEAIKLENTISTKGDVWVLTINRPQSLNALNSQVLGDLHSALEILEKKSFSEAKCLIVTGSGEKAFVAGADIKEMNGLDSKGGMAFAEKGQQLFRRFENLKIPVIAAVNGFALGGGLELALACDYIFASENAKLGLPEVTLGLIPGFGGTVRLSRAVGLNRAKEMVFTGDMLTAAEAIHVGLVNRVVPLPELLPLALKSAETIAKRGPVAVQNAKRSLQNSYDQDIDQGMKTEASEFAQLFSTADFREGTTAFVEKRAAIFKGN
jgi:enoyl-CoA hydratase